jgi:hypothetical protein
MVAAGEFIVYGEKLESGALSSATGINRALHRLAQSTDALLDVLQSDRNMVLVGGGTLAWEATGGTFTRTSNITLRMLNEVGATSSNVLSSATALTLATAGNVAYAILDRETDGATVTVGVAASMSAFLTLITGNADRLDYQLLAVRDGTGLVLWDGRRILDGESLTNDGFTDTQYAQQSEMDTVHKNQKENLQFLLHGGGWVTWDETAGTITWDDDLTIAFPAYAGNNIIPADSATVAAGEFLVVTLTREPGSSLDISGTISVVADGSVALGDDVFVIGHHDANDGRFYFWEGTSLNDGDRRRLGGVGAGVDFFYSAYGTATQVIDLTEGGTYPERSYKVGDGSLMVYMNGIKCKASAAYWSGSYPSGSLIGSLDDGDRYVEEDDGTSNGTNIIFLADGQATSEPLYHPASTHTLPFAWPSTTDWLEAFVGLQGEGPSPMDSLGIYPEPGGGPFTGNVTLKEGADITLTYDAPNNAIVIAAALSAGVASLEANGGSEGAQTGAIVVDGGTNITVDDSVPGTLTIDCDIALSAGQVAALAGAYAPSASNPFATEASVDPLIGFDLIAALTEDEIHISSGTFYLSGEQYPVADKITVATTDTVTADAPGPGGWAYLYLGPGTSDGAVPVGYVGGTAPVAGLHPSDSDLHFLSSVYFTASSKFAPFTKRGHQVELSTIDVPISHSLNPASTSPQTVGVAAAMPDSAGPSAKMLLEYVTSSPGQYEFRWGPGSHVGSSYRYKKLHLENSMEYTLEIEVCQDDNGDAGLVFNQTTGAVIFTINGLYLVGYDEGRYSSASNTWV